MFPHSPVSSADNREWSRAAAYGSMRPEAARSLTVRRGRRGEGDSRKRVIYAVAPQEGTMAPERERSCDCDAGRREAGEARGHR